MSLGCASEDSPSSEENDCDEMEAVTLDGVTYQEAPSESQPGECSPSVVYGDSTHPFIEGPGHSVVTVGAEWEVADEDRRATFSLVIGDPDDAAGPDVEEKSYSLVIPGGGVGAEASVLVGRLTPEMGSCLSTAGTLELETWAGEGEIVVGSFEVTEWGGANCPIPPTTGSFRVRHIDP